MIKRMPQEIADFFRCYVVKNEDGSWEAHDMKPESADTDNGFWIVPDAGAYNHIDILVDEKTPHDWTHLYEPRNIIPDSGEINEVFGRNCQKDNLCSHSSEVYTHREYNIVCGSKGMGIDIFIKGVMAWVERGWKPVGGISFDKDGHMYQAMVRGV